MIVFRKETTFVIGAGASAEIGLPVGAELRSLIGELVNITFEDGYTQSTGDYEVCEALRLEVRHSDGRSGNINPHLHSAKRLAEALPLALSVDNYLEAHQSDELTVLVGKLGITKAILEAEHRSALAYDWWNANGPDLTRIGQNWLTRFFQMASEGVTTADVDRIFENVAFIVYNYDRCLELFIFEALKVYYGLSSSTALSILGNTRIFHPYGTVGQLALEGRGGVSFGAQKQGAKLLELSKSIRTFSERIDAGNELLEARDWMRQSEQVIFLGTAYHRQNLELIDPVLPSRISAVLGTSLGISSSDAQVVKDMLPSYLQYHPNDRARLHPLTASDLLEKTGEQLRLEELLSCASTAPSARHSCRSSAADSHASPR